MNTSLIYKPQGQAGEYAPYALNHYRGCGHGCVYCYVPRIPFAKITREEFNAGAEEKKTFSLERLQRDAEKFRDAGIKEYIMLSFMTDPYNHDDVELQLTRKALWVLKHHGLSICTLTKGGKRALRDIDLFDPSTDWFATTLTSLDEAISLKWEPKAAIPEDRIETLKQFHQHGIRTWVSLEPVYDTAATIEIIRRTHDFVDLYKVGKMNYLNLKIDWEQFTEEVMAELNRLGAKHYIKKDLQPYIKARTSLLVASY
jgi:DNA repair photolyase